MSKKGVNTLSWYQAVFNPASIEEARKLQLQELAAQKAYLRSQALQRGAQHLEKDDNLFAAKQLAGKYDCIIAQDKFPKGAELEWIQAIKSIDHKDKDPDHQNQDAILLHIEKTNPSDAKKLAEKVVIQETNERLAEPKKEINGIFIEQILYILKTSSSQSLIVNLSNPTNETAPLAFAILKGENGLWLHDSKLGCSVYFKKEDTENFKKFLVDHIQLNHQGFNKGSIVRVGNKESLKSELKDRHTDTRKKGVVNQQELAATKQLKSESKQENVEKAENKSKDKNKIKPTPT